MAALPPAARERAAAFALRGAPLDHGLEALLVEEVRACWDGIPLPDDLPALVDHARLLALLDAVEARAGALQDGPDAAGRWLKIATLAPLEELLARGRGVVVLTPTFGAWSQIAPALARRGYRVGLLDLRPPERRPARMRPGGSGLDLRPLRPEGYARELVRFAAQPGSVVVALADEGCGRRYGTGTLLGRAASIGSTPFELARRADLGLLPVFAVRLPSEHRLVVEKALDVRPDADPDSELDRLAGRWLRLVEQNARRRPPHYFSFLLTRRLSRDRDPVPLFA